VRLWCRTCWAGGPGLPGVCWAGRITAAIFLAPLDRKEKVVRLRFEAVYYRASVSLNGQPVGPTREAIHHSSLTLPHCFGTARTNSRSLSITPGGQDPARGVTSRRRTGFAWYRTAGLFAMFRWWSARRFNISNVKVESVPDLDDKTASVLVRAYVHNAFSARATASLEEKLPACASKPKLLKSDLAKTKEVQWKNTVKQSGSGIAPTLICMMRCQSGPG